MSEFFIRDGDLLAVERIPPFGVDLLDLSDTYRETCDGCGGTGIAHAGDPIPGPCGSCWGVGRVLFAMHADELAASIVPQPVAIPFLTR